MKKKSLLPILLVTLSVIILNVQVVLAHETVVVGDYEIEVGWLHEPPIAGLQNGVVLEVSNTAGGEAQPVENVASLTVTLSYGGQTKELSLQPIGEDTPGEFMAPVLPTVPGEYEVLFGGSLGETAVDAHTHIEEVQPADTIQFPVVESAAESDNSGWLMWLSLVVGLIGVGMGLIALGRKR